MIKVTASVVSALAIAACPTIYFNWGIGTNNSGLSVQTNPSNSPQQAGSRTDSDATPSTNRDHPKAISPSTPSIATTPSTQSASIIERPYFCHKDGANPTIFGELPNDKRVKILALKSLEFVNPNDPESGYPPERRCAVISQRMNDLHKDIDTERPYLYMADAKVRGTTYKTIRFKKENCISRLLCDGLLLTVSPSKTSKEADGLLEGLKEGNAVDGSTPTESPKKLNLIDIR